MLLPVNQPTLQMGKKNLRTTGRPDLKLTTRRDIDFPR